MNTTTPSPGRGKGPRAAEACPPAPAPISLVALAGVTPLAADLDHTRSATAAGSQPVWTPRPTRRSLEPMPPLDAPNDLPPGADVMIWRNVACSLPSICGPA